MRVLSAGVHLQLLDLLTAERAVGQHAADAATDGLGRVALEQVLVNVRVAHRHPHAAEEMAAEIAAAEDLLQGDGRILVRASGTEPLIRVMVEAATHSLAQSVADDLAAVVLTRWG